MVSQPQNPVHNSARLFLALVPGEDVRAAVVRHRDQWRWNKGEAQYAPQDWHVTLHFIGSVARHRLDELCAGLHAPITPFDLHFGRPELWSRGLAVLCPTDMPEVLRQLHSRLGQDLQRLGLQADSRPYRPHITLARHAQEALLPPTQPTFVWHVADYALMESTGQAHQRYRVVHQYRTAP